ncbi:MAG TPA: FecR domain-containing protein [Puia sp.]|nr:FecR domain-containing protein [Puia sp.]
MKKEEIIALMEGYGAGTLTPEEEIVFLQWYSASSLEEFHELLAQCRDLPPHLSWFPAMPEGLRTRLEQDIRNFDADEEAGEVRRLPLLRRIHRGWAAAAVLVLLAGSFFAIFHHPEKQVDTVDHPPLQRDAEPGRTRAVLTLADGSRITLDSAKTGQLAMQGTTKVTKQNGAVTYSAKGAAGLLYNTLTTARGEQSPPLTLSDGTRVWLNAASSIRYPVAFSGDARKVEITGEAYFEVAKDHAKPFFVKVRGMEVQVLGTSFDINAYQDEPGMRTTLLEGSVRVIAGETTAHGPRDMLLQPGQQVQVGNGNGMRLVKEADVDQVMAWKNGLFNFNHTDLQSVLRQLARWYDIDVQFEGSPSPRTFHGKITRDLRLSQVIGLLHEVEVKFRIEDGKLIVTQ